MNRLEYWYSWCYGVGVVDEELLPVFHSKHRNRLSDLYAILTIASDDEFYVTTSTVVVIMCLLSYENSNVCLEKRWNPKDKLPITEIKVVVDQISKEHLLRRELDEAARYIGELNKLHFHHNLMKQGR